jgi:hypothetical protein
MSIKSAAAFVESSGWPYPDPFVKIITVLLEIKKKASIQTVLASRSFLYSAGVSGHLHS